MGSVPENLAAAERLHAQQLECASLSIMPDSDKTTRQCRARHAPRGNIGEAGQGHKAWYRLCFVILCYRVRCLEDGQLTQQFDMLWVSTQPLL